MVKEIRDEMSMLGTRKLLFKLLSHFHKHRINMTGISCLIFYGFTIIGKKTEKADKNYKFKPWLKKYPNLVKGLNLILAEQLLFVFLKEI